LPAPSAATPQACAVDDQHLAIAICHILRRGFKGMRVNAQRDKRADLLAIGGTFWRDIGKKFPPAST